MEVKKVANLSEAEMASLITAGEILGAVNKALETGEIDELSQNSVQLVEAIKSVSVKVLER